MIWNVPNILTLSRVLIAPLVIYLYQYQHFVGAFALLCFLLLTDFFDGYLARRLKQTSHLGEILDPVADKVVTLIFYSYIGFLELAPWWFVTLVLIRNFSQLMCIPILVWWLKRTFYVKPKKFAKWATTFSDLFILCPLFVNFWLKIPFIINMSLILIISFMEFKILITYIPRLIAIARGSRDTFE